MVIKEKDETVHYCTLKVGDVFKSKKGEVFMRTQRIYDGERRVENAVTCVNLKDGNLNDFDDMASVYKLEHELIIK